MQSTRERKSHGQNRILAKQSRALRARAEKKGKKKVAGGKDAFYGGILFARRGRVRGSALATLPLQDASSISILKRGLTRICSAPRWVN